MGEGGGGQEDEEGRGKRLRDGSGREEEGGRLLAVTGGAVKRKRGERERASERRGTGGQHYDAKMARRRHPRISSSTRHWPLSKPLLR